MRHRVSIHDLGILLAIIGVLAYVCFAADVFVNEGHVSAATEVIELDEILLLGVTLSIGLLVFAIRRYAEQKKEMRRRQEAERLARELAFQDPLTGLPNRRQFEDALALALAQPPAAGSCHAVMMLDLNGFKKINDTYGHAAGDEVLTAVARRLQSAVRTGDLVARLGGDEFVVLALHVLGPDGAANIAARILAALAAPVPAAGKEHRVGSGVGVALLPDDASERIEVMRKADVALYRAKEENRSAMRFFEPSMDDVIHEREVFEHALTRAMQNDEIEPRYSPTIDLQTGAVIGFEVRPHWASAIGRMIAPERFLAIAEDTGYVHALGELLLRKACDTAREWPDGVMLSIDLLPGQIRNPDLGKSMLTIMRDAGFPAGRLEVEIAENVIVKHVESAKVALAPLQHAGVKITLDKFGTGYSNLYHLQEFAFDKVKIDRRFTERLGDKSADRVVKALAGLGHGLGIVVVADGIADADMNDRLLVSGVQAGQSDGAPITADEAKEYFALRQQAGGDKAIR